MVAYIRLKEDHVSKKFKHKWGKRQKADASFDFPAPMYI